MRIYALYGPYNIAYTTPEPESTEMPLFDHPPSMLTAKVRRRSCRDVFVLVLPAALRGAPSKGVYNIPPPK